MTDEEADKAQEWAKVTPAVAWQLIDRHADGWEEIDAMMRAYLRAQLKPEREERERLTKFDPNIHADAKRVIDWLNDPNRNPANVAFTEGMERQLAYTIEDAICRIDF